MNNNKDTHRPMRPSLGNIENIKAQFTAQQENKVVTPGAAYSKTEVELTEEQQAAAHVEAQKQKFYPFPESGHICEWMRDMSHPERPPIFIIVVNLEEDATKEPRPGFFATCRQPEVAQMLCDGVNFLFKCQKEMETAAPPQMFQPVVIDAASEPNQVDTNKLGD